MICCIRQIILKLCIMKNYNSIDEIREKIDKLDLEILDLILKRKDLVTAVVKLKKRDQIIDQRRIDNILKKIGSEADEKGLSGKFAEDLWRLMIKNFIEYEEKIFDEVHKKSI